MKDLEKSLEIVAMTDEMARAGSGADVYAAFARHLPAVLPVSAVAVFEREAEPGKEHVRFTPVRGEAGGSARPFTAVWSITVSGRARLLDGPPGACPFAPLFTAMGCPPAILHVPVGERALAIAAVEARFQPSRAEWQLLDGLARQAAAAVERLEALGRIRELSLEDGRTGLGNRRLVELMLERSFAGAERGDPLSVVSIRTPPLELAREGVAGVAADVQARVAGVLREQVRQTDVLARVGDGVFVVVLHDAPASGARAFLRRVLSLFDCKVRYAVAEHQGRFEGPGEMLSEVLDQVGVNPSDTLN